MSEGDQQSIEELIQSIFTVTSRRTSIKFAQETFLDAINILKVKYKIFNHIELELESESIYTHGFQIKFNVDITHLNKHDVARSLESLIRLIYDDIPEEAGLYFITEIKNHISKENIDRILQLGIDLEEIQNEQNISYSRKKRKKGELENGKKENPLGYKWSTVSKWDYNEQTKQVELYDNQGTILDKIDLEQAIRHYVESLSGSTELSTMDLENLMEEYEKSYSFLKLIYQENLEFETAKDMLNLSDEEITKIIKELIELKFLEYVSDDEVELTESGKKFIDK
jgi:hypothetical protein